MVGQVSRDITKESLLTHACATARCWGYHARYTQFKPTIEKLILDFLHNGKCLQHAAQFNSITPLIHYRQIPQEQLVFPLHVASYFGLTSIVEYLLSGGADAMAMTYWNASPLHNAQNEEIASLLLFYGAELDCADSEGRTPLMQHAWDDHAVMVTKLLDWGADVNVASKIGNTALHEVRIQKFNLCFSSMNKLYNRYVNAPLPQEAPDHLQVKGLTERYLHRRLRMEV